MSYYDLKNYLKLNIGNVLDQCNMSQSFRDNEDTVVYKTTDGLYHKVTVQYDDGTDKFTLNINNIHWGTFNNKGEVYEGILDAINPIGGTK